MSVINAERLRMLLAEQQISQSELARRVGVTQGTIAKMVGSRPVGSSHLHKVARVLGTTPAYLTNETDDPVEGALPTPTADVIADQLDAVMVPLYELDFSMGDGSFFDQVLPAEHIPFKKPWLRAHAANRVEDIMMINSRGDSMTPTISDGDVLMIDRGEQQVSDPDLIWAFAYAEAGYVKRLRKLPRGRIEVNSDNPAVRSWAVDAAEINIVGRVVSILRWQ